MGSINHLEKSPSKVVKISYTVCNRLKYCSKFLPFEFRVISCTGTFRHSSYKPVVITLLVDKMCDIFTNIAKLRAMSVISVADVASSGH